MKIYLVRHGETDWNKQLIIQGRTDNQLNQIGRDQAAEIARFFQDKNIDLVISSSLSRAIETATIAIHSPDLIDDGFIERDFGALDGDLVENFYKTVDLTTVENYENDDRLIKRVKSALFSYYNQDQQVAIFTHSHVLKTIRVIAEPENYSYASVIKNCAILEIEITATTIKLVAIH